MTALTQDFQIERRDGDIQEYPVVADDIIYGGSLVAVNAAGYALPGSDTAGLIFQGVAEARADNAGGAAGDINVEVRRRGVFKLTAGSAVAQANVGDPVYLVDDQTVDIAADTTNDIFCGVIVGFIDSTHVWVDIAPPRAS